MLCPLEEGHFPIPQRRRGPEGPGLAAALAPSGQRGAKVGNAAVWLRWSARLPGCRHGADLSVLARVPPRFVWCHYFPAEVAFICLLLYSMACIQGGAWGGGGLPDAVSHLPLALQ